MPEQPQRPLGNMPPSNKNGLFKAKPVDQPILGSDMSDRLRQSTFAQRSFYAANKIYIWGLVVGVVVIGTLGYLAFHKKPAVAPKEANVQITIDAPQTVPSGQEEIYKIKIDNQDTEKLTNLQLEVVYPDGFTYDSSSPKSDNLSGSSFTVPDLTPGNNAVVIVKVKASGAVNDSKDLLVRLHYHYTNFNSEFVKEQHFTVRLAASDIGLNIEGPSQTNNGQLVIFNLTYFNNSSADAKGARIKITYPDGFSFGSSNPSPSLGQDTWDLGTLAQGGSGTISIQGSFTSANPGESKTMEADFLILGSDGQYYTQSSATFITAISSQPLVVTQTVQDSQTPGIVNPGDALTFNVHYQNGSQVAANAVNVVVTLDSQAVDLSTISAEGAQISGNTITWNAASASNLQIVAPNESGDLQFSVRVKNPATKDSSKNLSVTSHIKIKSSEYENFFPGPDVSLKVSSPSSITTSLAFVAGSLPPKVGTVSTYKVTFTLRNSTNDFSNTVVSAFIPLGAGGFDQTSVNAAEQRNVQYDPATGKLTWTVGALQAHTGQFSPARTLTFNVRLNPSSNQAFTSPTLVKSIAMDATDLFTSAAVHDTADDITTDSVQGQFGNGQVQQ